MSEPRPTWIANPSPRPPSRRELLGGLVGLGLLGPGVSDAKPPELRAERKRALRLAHMTDIHVQPERAAGEGLVAALRHVQSLPDKPELILQGGDVIMDALAVGRDRTRVQWELLTRVLKSDCGLPIEHCLGNHDVWGWDRAKSGATGNEADYGKKWALDVLGLAKPYRSFDRAGWHFVVLDSTHPGPDGAVYIGKLDDAQFDWLQADLAKVPASTPVLVLSHIPILSASAYLDGNNEQSGSYWAVPGAWMHIDARRIVQLFWKHRNVRLALSGHIHLFDRVDYNGVTYLCNGAVSGAWWKGNYHQTAPGYGVVDLYSDGSFAAEYVNTGWQPQAE